MKTIVLSGYYGFDNAGDEAVCKSIISDLRAHNPQLNIVVLSHQPEKTNQKLLEELKNKLKEENKELKIREINGEPKVYSLLKRYDNCPMI